MAHDLLAIDNNLIQIRISGIMRVADLKALQQAARELIDQGTMPRVLVMVEEFEGWEKNEEWNDVDFMMAYGNEIDRLAIVAEECWQDEIAMFSGKGLRATAIEIFFPSSLKEAELWLRC